jgi:hypothetical protein
LARARAGAFVVIVVVHVHVHAVVAPETAGRRRRRNGHDGGRRPSPDGGCLTPTGTVTVVALVRDPPPSSSISAGRKVCNGTHCFMGRVFDVWCLAFHVCVVLVKFRRSQFFSHNKSKGSRRCQKNTKIDEHKMIS